MHEFRVWAPTAGALQLVLRDRHVSMQRGENGWWCACVEDASAGTEYAFSVDGSEPLPDPRSPWQPHGVHGFSCLVDHAAFQWSDTHWQARPLPAAIIYELHVGTFTDEGTFDSAISRLPHLAGLGITHVELMPVNEFSGRWGWGYDGVDLFAPHHAYGGPDGLKRFIDAAHRHGLAVLLDVVYNHLGPAGNYLSRFGPYFTERHRTPWGEAVNLDGAMCDEVRHFFCANALMWLRDYHFDGLRIDAVHALLDTGAFHFLEQLAIAVEKLSIELGRHLVLIAESDLNDPRIIRPREMGGYGMDAQWSDDFHHALHSVLTGETAGYYCDFGEIGHLAKALQNAFVYDGSYSRHRQRPHGRRVPMAAGYEFLGYIQNHDQVGNRARGERIGQLVSPGLAKIAAGLVLTAPFVPMVFMGEEWNASSPFQYFTSHDDEELGRAVSTGRRSEFVDFGWHPEQVPDPQSQETFGRSKLRWQEIEEPFHAEFLDWYRSLIRLRRSSGYLLDGNLENLEVRYDEKERWLTLTRGPLVSMCNLASEPRRIPLAAPGEVLLSSTGRPIFEEGAIRLAPESFAVLKYGG